MKIIKEIKTEVVDLQALGRGIDYARVFSGEDVRIVMSYDTLNALRDEVQKMVLTPADPFSDVLHRRPARFEGVPIDINDELPRGEVRFTHEVKL